jgi:hypothetical protein
MVAALWFPVRLSSGDFDFVEFERIVEMGYVLQLGLLEIDQSLAIDPAQFITNVRYL